MLNKLRLMLGQITIGSGYPEEGIRILGSVHDKVVDLRLDSLVVPIVKHDNTLGKGGNHGFHAYPQRGHDSLELITVRVVGCCKVTN